MSSKKALIETKLSEALAPTHLDVIDESSAHNVPAGSETHFKVVVASDRFVGKSRIERHRLIHEILAKELAGSIHALTMQPFTLEEWSKAPDAESFASPPCLGGSKR